MISLGSWLASLDKATVLREVGAGAINTVNPPGGLRMGADMNKLRASLRRCLDRNELYFRFAFGLSALLSLATIFAPFLPMVHDKTMVTALFGLTTSASVAGTVSLYKEKNSFDIMLELAVGLGEDEMRKVLDVLIRRKRNR